MKKILFSLFALTMALGFSSCQETWDNAPTLEGHEGIVEADFLNVPAMQNQYLMITQDNSDGTFQLTCSQPFYGYAAVATYKVQVSLKGTFEEEGKDYIELNQDFYNCSNINPVNHQVAAAVEKLAGVESDEDLPLPWTKVYMRLYAYINQSPENTQYVSNVVWFNYISADYFAIWTPGEKANLYLRGGMNDWGSSADWQFVTSEVENQWVIPHEVTIEAGTEFKVADSEWGAVNLGAGDTNTVKLNEAFQLTNAGSSGNLHITEDFTGKVIVTMEKGTYYLLLSNEEE